MLLSRSAYTEAAETSPIAFAPIAKAPGADRSASTIAFGFALSLLFWNSASGHDPWVDAPKPDAQAWVQIRKIAEEYVSKETPADVLPFQLDGGIKAGPNAKLVFAHYFPPFPLSHNNLDAKKDIYSTTYLRREGEGGKYAAQGGMVRARPLPVGPWASQYWVQINDAIEVLRARRMGLDGFAYDVVDLQNGRWGAGFVIMLDAALNVAPEFKIVPEPDCGVLEKATKEEIGMVLAQVWAHPATFHLPDGRMLVAPFAAGNKPIEYWEGLISAMEVQGKPIALMPVLLNPNKDAHDFLPISYGESSWGDRDTTLTDVRLRLEEAKVITPATIWMMPVTPQDERPKPSILWEAQNTLLYRKEWMEAIHNGSQFVQLITWNDFSESTQIEPSSTTQFVFYDLGMFYTYWFKTGKMPRISKDAIYYTHRREIFQPQRLPRQGDKPFQVLGSAPISNEVEMVAFLTSGATLEVELDGTRRQKLVDAGLADFHVAAQPGRPIFRIVREGKVVLETVSNWSIVDQEDALDPIYAGGSSNRPFLRGE